MGGAVKSLISSWPSRVLGGKHMVACVDSSRRNPGAYHRQHCLRTLPWIVKELSESPWNELSHHLTPSHVGR